MTRLVIVVAVLSLVACKKTDQKPEPTPAPATKSTEVAPKPATPPPPATTGKVMDGIKAITPPLPKGADAFEWKRESPGDTSVTWRLKEKAAPHAVALILELDDFTERVKAKDTPTYETKLGDFPAKRGKDFVRVLAGNVQVGVSTGSKAKLLAADDKAAAELMDAALNSVDLAAISKL
jgi:hypothetical protein